LEIPLIYKHYLHLPDGIKMDKRMALKAIVYNPEIYLKLSKELMKNEDLFLEFMKKTTSLEEIKVIPFYSLLKHEKVCIALLSSHFTPLNLLLMEAIKKRGKNLQYLPLAFKNDLEIISLAVYQSSEAGKFLPKKIKQDKKIILELVGSGMKNEHIMDKTLRTDRDVIIECLKYNETLPQELPSSMLKDDQLMMMWLKKDESYFKKSKMKKNKKVILELIKHNKEIWKFLDEEKFVLDKEIQWLHNGNFKLIRETAKNIYFTFQ
jgi:hypothetical protein